MDNLSTLQQEIPDEAALKEAENSIRGLQLKALIDLMATWDDTLLKSLWREILAGQS